MFLPFKYNVETLSSVLINILIDRDAIGTDLAIY